MKTEGSCGRANMGADERAERVKVVEAQVDRKVKVKR